MKSEPATVGGGVAPLLISLVLHFIGFLFLLFYGSIPSRDPNLKFEVQFQEASGTDLPRVRKKTLAHRGFSRDLSTPGKITEVSGGGDAAEVLGTEVGIRPLYPRVSRILGEVGTVQIQIEDEGVRISQTSGFARLDQSALSATNEALRTGLISKQSSKKILKIRFVFRLIEPVQS